MTVRWHPYELNPDLPAQGVPRRGVWVTGGIAAGVVGASLVAVCAGAIAAAVNSNVADTRSRICGSGFARNVEE